MQHCANTVGQLPETRLDCSPAKFGLPSIAYSIEGNYSHRIFLHEAAGASIRVVQGSTYLPLIGCLLLYLIRYLFDKEHEKDTNKRRS
jgi:hypothetical protein